MIFLFLGARNGSQTLDNGAIGCAFSPWKRWYKNCDAATKNDRVMKIWRFFIPIFMNFDKLKINYELILSKISKNGLQTHPPPWLRNIKIHIIDTSPWLRDNKIMEHTHDSGAIGCAFSSWTRRYKHCDATTKNGRVMKIWRFLIYSHIHEFWQIKY